MIEIYLSVVSGTYNRIKWLQKMVQSVRQSVTKFHGLTYEIVLVDGGSVDGTIGWCKQQPDIMLIEQGELLGAVKAFNAGAFAANGEYVILANDDIEFLGDTISTAWLYMQQNLDCGIGCIYQDRDRQHLPDNDTSKWQIEKMPVSLNGKQSMMWYGQVCIVPKWLGDNVNWWCDDLQYKMIGADRRDRNIKPLHTYAGDNELSSRIYALGFKITPITGTKIHDNEAQDGLRTINNISGGKDPRSVKGHHPDSWSWGRKWRNIKTDVVGAVVKNMPLLNNPMEIKERILYLPIFEPGWEVQKEQKRGLREALARVGVVKEYDYFLRYAEIGKKGMIKEITQLCQELRPTLVVTQIHNSDMIDAQDIRRLKSQFPARYVNWNGDVWPKQLLDDKALQLASEFDLNTVINRNIIEHDKYRGTNTKYWQIGWEPLGQGDNCHPSEYHDVVFLASGYSKERQELGAVLKNKLGNNLGLYGSGWPDGWSKGQNLYNFSAACKIYRGAKLAIGDSQWPESGFVSNRIFQILAAGGCALCHQWFREYEQLGLIDKVNCLIWKNFEELGQILKYWLPDSRSQKLAEIASNGEKLGVGKHSFDVRVKELFEMLGKGIEKVSEESWRW